ncbi:MAG: HAD hydrolase-like protein [Gemmatimonadetes bacterium]|nr:HAD hydrolase-like protein [Gemmatimonadota bacterium]
MPFDVITFDCYGTLIDWEAGIAEAFLAAARGDGVALDRGAVLAAYAEVEPAVEAGRYRLYRDVLAETAVEVARRLGWGLSREEARFLPESLPRWEPFPDTGPALEALCRAGYALGILSNVDDDLLAGTRRRFPVGFDLLVTAQQVGSYKPAPGHFLEARRRLAGRRWLHAAQSYFHDVEPAGALGIPVVWVNRKGERPGGAARPEGEVADLAALVPWLARAR